MKRPITLVLLAALVLAVAAGAYWFTTNDSDPSGVGGDGDEVARDLTEDEVLDSAPLVYYVEGDALKSIGARDDEGEIVREGLSPYVTGADQATYVTWVEFGSGDQPVIQLYDRAADEKETISGTAPVWDEAGQRFAYLSPTRLGSCSETDCEVPVQVVVFDTGSGESKLWLDQGRWSIVGWAGDELIVGDAKNKSRSSIVDAEGDTRRLRIAFGDIKSVSPDGEWVISSKQSGPELVRIADGIDRSPLGDNDDTVTFVDWASDSSRAAVVATFDEDPPRLFIVDTESRSIEPFNEDEVVGEVFWGPDDQGVVLTRVDRDELQLQASFCRIEAPDKCVSLLEWQTNIRVVGVDER